MSAAMGRRSLLARGLLPLALTACRGPADLVVHDSEGRAFEARCDKEKQGDCALTQTHGTKWPGSQPAVTLRSTSRVIGVCNAAEGQPVDSTIDCRPLVCKKDTDCPPSHGLPKGTCLGGLCTDQSHAMDESDAVLLCLAGTGLGHDSLSQLERFAMAQQCGHPCQVPTPCRQP
jgi:hypothetical protein